MTRDRPLYLSGTWTAGEGEPFPKIDPSTGEEIAEIRAASPSQIRAATGAAREALSPWEGLSPGARRAIVETFAALLREKAESLASLISLEVGKPPWEAATEVTAMAGKIPISIDAFEKRCGEFSSGPAVTRFRPHGVVAVLGPFNFPGHLPNGHIVPALLAGNTVVFKPSELAPLTAIRMVELWEESGLPPGVINLIQGGGGTGKTLMEESAGLDGVFFTGSAGVGQRLREHFAKTPGKMLALEMGGNNPLVVEEVADLEAAVVITLQSAFLTAGQRCTCARRLIVPDTPWGERFLQTLAGAVDGIVTGAPGEKPVPFMGPVISEAAARRTLDFQAALVRRGAIAIREARHLREGTGLLRPGLLDVTPVSDREDEEIFGPLLQVIRVAGFDEAIREANRTEFGLAAGLIGESEENWKEFRIRVRAGVMNWNQQLTGASSSAPFGGVGRSGNFRPGAFFAADYCSWPVASIEASTPGLPSELPPGISLP